MPKALKTGLRSILLNRKTGGAAETMQDVSAKCLGAVALTPLIEKILCI
ncbi:MAG: Uncharacterised protein [Cellvibrionales bacterium UBA7375]|nr:MAG: Uncharacterised protein [Cellvibrionales bacterium UBA7375]